jgi:prevent-host-death family protein
MTEKIISIRTAKSGFSKIVAQAEAGDEIILTRRGKPVAKLIPLATTVSRPKRVPGRLKGQITIGPEFFEPMSEEELELWYESPVFPS